MGLAVRGGETVLELGEVTLTRNAWLLKVIHQRKRERERKALSANHYGVWKPMSLEASTPHFGWGQGWRLAL